MTNQSLNDDVKTVVRIRDVRLIDAQSIAAIYNEYIAKTVISFEEEAITTDEMGQRIDKIRSDKLPWIVAESAEGELLGYAYASLWRERSAYRFSAEVSVYLSAEAQGRGVGSRLYHQLFKELEKTTMHMVMSVIALPNEASIALHEKLGMEKVAHFKEVGYKFGNWIDVGYWQRVL